MSLPYSPCVGWLKSPLDPNFFHDPSASPWSVKAFCPCKAGHRFFSRRWLGYRQAYGFSFNPPGSPLFPPPLTEMRGVFFSGALRSRRANLSILPPLLCVSLPLSKDLMLDVDRLPPPLPERRKKFFLPQRVRFGTSFSSFPTPTPLYPMQ